MVLGAYGELETAFNYAYGLFPNSSTRDRVKFEKDDFGVNEEGIPAEIRNFTVWSSDGKIERQYILYSLDRPMAIEVPNGWFEEIDRVIHLEPLLGEVGMYEYKTIFIPTDGNAAYESRHSEAVVKGMRVIRPERAYMLEPKQAEKLADRLVRDYLKAKSEKSTTFRR